MLNRYFTEIFPKPKAALKTKPTQPKKVSASILNFGIKYLSGHVRTYKYLQLAETRRNIGTEKTLTGKSILKRSVGCSKDCLESSTLPKFELVPRLPASTDLSLNLIWASAKVARIAPVEKLVRSKKILLPHGLALRKTQGHSIRWTQTICSVSYRILSSRWASEVDNA